MSVENAHTETATTQAIPSPDQPQSSGAVAAVTTDSGLMQGLRWTVVVLAVLAALLGLYWSAREVARHETGAALRRGIGVVDLEQALSLQRARYLRIVTDEQASEKDKADATAFIKSSSERINQALAQVAQECDCILLIRPAVLQHQSAGLVDHTRRLLDFVSEESVKALEPVEK